MEQNTSLFIENQKFIQEKVNFVIKNLFRLKDQSTIDNHEQVNQEILIFVWKRIGKFDYRKSNLDTYIINITKFAQIAIANNRTNSEDFFDKDLFNEKTVSLETIEYDIEDSRYAKHKEAMAIDEVDRTAKEAFGSMIEYFETQKKQRKAKILKKLSKGESWDSIISENYTQHEIRKTLQECRVELKKVHSELKKAAIM